MKARNCLSDLAISANTTDPGGLSTSIKALKANLLLSGLVALVGISAPIGLSFVLQSLLDITPLQAFAAGAALCSTSLGTTFTVLSTSGLTQSRLGVVLTSAAMMDDVVGLVMVQVISNLGGATSSFNAVTVIRPICVSIAFAVVIPLLCVFLVKPLTIHWYGNTRGKMWERFASPETMLVLHTSVFIALVVGSSYAGTSNLFAAYLAGASITWWDTLCGELSQPVRQPPGATPVSGIQSRTTTVEQPKKPKVARCTAETRSEQELASTTNTQSHIRNPHLSGTSIYDRYYGPAVSAILKPLFFASIGFSIPITKMFAGHIVWRGIVYAALMVIGKMFCGLGLVRFAGSFPSLQPLKRLLSINLQICRPGMTPRASDVLPPTSDSRAALTEATKNIDLQPITRIAPSNQKKSAIPKPRSLHPAAILGCAMVARGEIGFLISSVAESRGIFGADVNGTSSELFLIVTWAILLCTILGPIAVGLLVRRMKRLQVTERERSTEREDPLGVWGIGERT